MINVDKLKEEQIRLAGKIVLSDGFDKIEKIAGMDFLYTDDKIICSIVVMDYKTLQVVERKYAIDDPKFPYIPGFLNYRIGHAAMNAFEKLEHKPDVMIVGANGILHPRKIGAASAVGLFTDTPTIGIAKKKLCGEEKDDSVYIDKEIVGKRFVTKESAKPVYASQGHKISLTSAIEIIKNMLKGHKLPEPLYLAHKYGNKIKANMTGTSEANKEAKEESNADSDKEE